jgi:hypothetical protein
MNIEEYTSELRALFVSILDVKTGDGACALSLLDALEADVKREGLEMADHPRGDDIESIGEVLDSLIQALEGLNKRLKKLENETHNRED